MCIANFLNGANLFGYIRCRYGKKDAQDAAMKYVAPQLLRNVRLSVLWNVFSRKILWSNFRTIDSSISRFYWSISSFLTDGSIEWLIDLMDELIDRLDFFRFQYIFRKSLSFFCNYLMFFCFILSFKFTSIHFYSGMERSHVEIHKEGQHIGRLSDTSRGTVAKFHMQICFFGEITVRKKNTNRKKDVHQFRRRRRRT